MTFEILKAAQTMIDGGEFVCTVMWWCDREVMHMVNLRQAISKLIRARELGYINDNYEITDELHFLLFCDARVDTSYSSFRVEKEITSLEDLPETGAYIVKYSDGHYHGVVDREVVYQACGAEASGTPVLAISYLLEQVDDDGLGTSKAVESSTTSEADAEVVSVSDAE